MPSIDLLDRAKLTDDCKKALENFHKNGCDEVSLENMMSITTLISLDVLHVVEGVHAVEERKGEERKDDTKILAMSGTQLLMFAPPAIKAIADCVDDIKDDDFLLEVVDMYLSMWKASGEWVKEN